MESGIYRLTFSSGKYYIGKTNNFKRRWEEHFDKMSKGTAAKPVQAEFDNYGYPSCSVMFECHADHAGLMEPYFIVGNLSSNMLNTTIPVTGSEQELQILQDNEDLLKNSTASICAQLRQKTWDHMTEMRTERSKHSKLLKEISSIKEGTRVPELETEIQNLESQCYEHILQLQQLKARSLWDRIFNN